MDLSRRNISLAGMAMIIGAILTILTVGLSIAGSSEKSPFERDEVAQFLTDTEENADLLTAAGAVGIANDGVFTLAVGAALYFLFRDRNRFLATLVLVSVTAAATLSLIVDISNVLLVAIAKDYVSGGAGGVAAGDPASLELGRYVGMITFAFTNLLFTPVGTAFVSLGLVILGPKGRVNPPRWLGWVAIISGLSAWLAWGVVAADPLFVFFPIQLISTVILLIGLGVWLLQHGELESAMTTA